MPVVLEWAGWWKRWTWRSKNVPGQKGSECSAREFGLDIVDDWKPVAFCSLKKKRNQFLWLFSVLTHQTHAGYTEMVTNHHSGLALLPLWGFFSPVASISDRRGFALGYILLTWFAPLGIVIPCLPDSWPAAESQLISTFVFQIPRTLLTNSQGHPTPSHPCPTWRSGEENQTMVNKY